MNHIICELNENERIQWFNLFRNTNISFCHKTKCERCWEKIVTSTSLYAPICSGCVCTCTLYKNGLTRLMSANWLKSWKKQQRKSILHIFVLTSMTNTCIHDMLHSGFTCRPWINSCIVTDPSFFLSIPTNRSPSLTSFSWLYSLIVCRMFEESSSATGTPNMCSFSNKKYIYIYKVSVYNFGDLLN